MKARILPLGDIAEFGKSDHVALLLTLSPTEANEVFIALSKDAVEAAEVLSVRKMTELMQALAYASTGRDVGWVHDAFNTDGRSGVRDGDIPPGRTPIDFIDGVPVYDRL